MQFDKKVVIITGASAGIGRAAALRFAETRACVVLAARGKEGLDAVAEEVRARGGEALVIPTDVGSDEACEALVTRTVDAYGRIDVLVNNAGLHHRGPFSERTPQELARMIDINLRSPVLLTRLALPHLRNTRGTVVNVASLAGRTPLPEAVVYSSTKFGLRAFSLALAEELHGTGVDVTLVSPGPVDTGFIMEDLDGVSDLAFSQPISTAEEVADAVVACAHDGKRERALPPASAVLTTVAYLAPGFARALRPLLARRGRMTKDRLRRERS